MSNLSKERLEAIELFLNDFNSITNSLYDHFTTVKADEYYNAMLLVKGYLEDIYYDE